MARALADEMNAVPVAVVLRSSQPPAVPATLVTQLTLDRIEQLEAQCRSWHGPISAVVYLALLLTPQQIHQTEAPTTNEALQRALQELQEFHARMESRHVCQVCSMMMNRTEVAESAHIQTVFPCIICILHARSWMLC